MVPKLLQIRKIPEDCLVMELEHLHNLWPQTNKQQIRKEHLQLSRFRHLLSEMNRYMDMQVNW